MEEKKKRTPIFIGIGGSSASGKTLFANTIVGLVGGHVPVISQDWFYRSLTDKEDGTKHDWDKPESFDRQMIINTIKNWKDGFAQWVPRHDYTNYTRIENFERIAPAPVMIIEGILIFHDPEIAALLDIKIYIDCDPDKILGRRINRDLKDRGYSLEVILERYFTYVKPAFEKYILPMRKNADIIIYNNGDSGIANHKGIEVIVSYIKSELHLI